MKKFGTLLTLTMALLAGAIIATPFNASAATAVTTVTQSEAKIWLEGQVGKVPINPVDGDFPGQCASLAAQYYLKLTGKIIRANAGGTGHGYQYADDNHSVNLGWSRGSITANTILQLGDVIVTGSTITNPYGHVAIFYSGSATNASQIESALTLTGGVTKKTLGQNLVGKTYVRPVWKSATASSAPTLWAPTPTNFRTTDSITVHWSSVANATSYKYYLTQAPTAYAYEVNVRNDYTFSNSVAFNGLPAGRYYMFVQAVNSAGDGPQSNWIEFVVDELDYIPTKTTTYNGHQYSIYDYSISWPYAKELTERMGGHLVTITSKEENDTIAGLTASGKKDGYWLGASNTDWSVATWNNYGTPWKWVTGEPYSYSNWASNEPNGGGSNATKEHFAEIRKSYGNKWNDIKTTGVNTQGFILEIDDDIQPVATERHESNDYALFDKQMTWKDTKVYCESNGGHLATITSDAERKTVESLLDRGEKSWYWIGATDEAVKGTYKWVTDETFAQNASYVKWRASGNSKSIHADGRYVMMYKDNKTWTALRNYYEYSNDMQYFGFVCEFENTYKPLQSILLDKTTLTLAVGNSEILTVTYDPIDTTDEKAIVWSTSDESIVTVSNGVVTAHSYGEAVITARVGTKEATSTVKVNFNDLALTDITISGEPKVGKTLTFTAVAEGERESLSYTFYINRGNNVYYFNTNSSNESFSFTPLMPGNYTVVALAAAGNEYRVLYSKDFVVD